MVIRVGSVDVPCGTCTACCRDRTVLTVDPKSGDDVDAYDTVPIEEVWRGPVPVTLRGSRCLRWAESGDCIYLGESGCGIWDRRPAVCRVYDCRRQYLATPGRDRHRVIKPSVRRAAKARLNTLTQAERHAARYGDGPEKFGVEGTTVDD